MLILLSNDDGIRAPGLRALAEALTKLGRVVVVAPDRDQSAVSHSLTLHHPLRCTNIAADWYEVDGTPTDCINLGVNSILHAARPDIIVAGINDGANLGDDISYSGTVSAAMEGAILKISSVALSLHEGAERNYAVAAGFACKFVQQVFKRGSPCATFFNVNVPDVARAGDLCGVRITRQAKRLHQVPIIENVDPRGRPYFWIGGSEFQWMEEEGTDVEAVRAGYISITPLQLDLTNYAAYDELCDWRLTP